jgi:sulfur carrier protein
MIGMVVNGKPVTFETAPGVADLVRSVIGVEPGRGVAVARNGEVVPRRDWANIAFADGDNVEVVRATQGG